MPPERGQTVRVPSKPEWGLGEVIESHDGTVSVLFGRNVLKKFRSDLARFEVVEDTGDQEDHLASPTSLAPIEAHGFSPRGRAVDRKYPSRHL